MLISIMLAGLFTDLLAMLFGDGAVEWIDKLFHFFFG